MNNSITFHYGNDESMSYTNPISNVRLLFPIIFMINGKDFKEYCLGLRPIVFPRKRYELAYPYRLQVDNGKLLEIL